VKMFTASLLWSVARNSLLLSEPIFLRTRISC
jgi:hypothetical protein